MSTSEQPPRIAVRPLPPDRRPGSAKFAKAIGSYLPKVTSAVFERYGFHSAEIMTSWGTIVGADIARLTRPHVIRWPRADRTGEDGNGGGGGGGTLVVACDPAFALEVCFRTSEIIDRINRYFGYRAIARLKTLQTPGFAKTLAKSSADVAARSPNAEPSADLAKALALLERSVGAARRGSDRS